VSPDERISGEGDGTLDAAGTGARRHRLLPATRSPATVTFEAEVEDTSGRNVSGRATAIVHPAEFYLGTRLESWLVDAGSPTEVGIAAVDPRGKPVAMPSVSVLVTRREWQTVRRKGVGDTWQVVSEPVDVAVETRDVEIRDGRGAFRLTPPVPGLYRVRASASDVRGNPVRAGASFHAVGPGYAAWRRSSDSRVQLMPDKGSYAPGETARIQVHSPYENGTALVTVERQGVLWQRVIAMKGNAEAFELPILPEYEPNVTVGVVVARGRLPSPPGAEPDPDDLGAPSVRVGAVRLRVDPGANRLAVAVKPAVPEYRPGQDVEVGVEVRDRSGRGARAQVLVFAVDAAVLDLSGYSPADPFDTFFAPIGASVATGDSRDFLIRRILLGEKSEPGGDGGGDLTRKDFVALAFWDPEVVTGDDGRATVRFRAPDNLTRFRVFAVATSGEARFGLARTEFTVNRPLVVRPALPPFAETRDAFRMAVAVHGAPGATGEAIVKVEATGSVSLRGASEARVAVGEGRVREALFELVAGEAGEGTVRVSGRLGQERDAVQLKVPVRRRARTETVATSGSATAQVTETVEPPAGAAPDVGGLSVSVAPTALVGLDRAAKSLISYPHGCLEQRMSAILPNLYLEDLAATFGFAPGTEGDLRESVRKTLARLREFQRPDGGFGFWAGGSDASDPYLTAWTIRIAGIARERGFKADPGVIADAVAFLEKSLRTPRDASRDRPPDPDQAAFATFVLAEEGRTVGDLVALFVAKRRDLSRTGRAWLAAAAWKDGAAAAALDLMTEVLEGATVKGDEAELPVPRGDEWHGMASGDVALTSAALIAGARAVPTHPLLPRLATHLWAARRNGEWSGTHENGLALMALATWVRMSEGDAAPDLAVSPWLGATPLATWQFKSRSAPPRATDVPMRRRGA